ncbi:MAG: 5'/3'-nucleotidase SurE [Dehalococcoidales bacterium]|nr:MAG: 5'/3'-nucleotidase SurE [Dehalococcoidales bacterium]
MNILVTNDDGIDAPGLWALAEAMNRVGDTMVVAPDKEQSGVGTSVSLHSGVKVDEVPSKVSGVEAYAVEGTPSDCVIVGLRQLAKGRHIDMVISGINPGANTGRDIPYSGTVMATLQGYFRRIPSIAVSLAYRGRSEELRYDVAARVAESLAHRVEGGNMPTDVIINTNIPNIPLAEIKGMVTTRAATGSYYSIPRGRGSENTNLSVRNLPTIADLPHHSVGGVERVIDEGTDIWAILSDMISITPLRIDVTDHDSLTALEEHVTALQSDLLGDGKRI